MASEVEPLRDESKGDVGPVLVVDCGSVFTKAILVDVVEGSHRLVACGQALTRAASADDVIAGVRQAMAQVTEATGRPLLNERGLPLTPARADGVHRRTIRRLRHPVAIENQIKGQG